MLWAGATEEEPSASPAAGATAAGVVVGRKAGALGPVPTATAEGPEAAEGPAAAMSITGDPAAAKEGSTGEGDGP